MIVSGDQWRDSAIHKHVSILPQTYLLCFRLDEHAVFALAGGFFTTSTTWEALLWELEKQAQRGCAVCPRSHRSGLLNWTLRYLRLALLFALSLPYLFAGFLIWLQYAACWILAPRTGIKPSPLTVELSSLNYWTSRKSRNFLLAIFGEDTNTKR